MHHVEKNEHDEVKKLVVMLYLVIMLQSVTRMFMNRQYLSIGRERARRREREEKDSEGERVRERERRERWRE